MFCGCAGVERPKKWQSPLQEGGLKLLKPETRSSGHYFSRLTRNASQQVQTKALSTIMEEGSKEERERAKTVQDNGEGNR